MPYKPLPPPSPTQKTQLIFGVHAVLEALKTGKDIASLLVQRGTSNKVLDELKKACVAHQLVPQLVPIEKLNRITHKNHQGVIAFISPITYHRIADIIPSVYELGQAPLVVILDRVTDVRNFGAIARTLECAGGHALIIPNKGSAQVNADAIKTSAGALHQVSVCREHSLVAAASFLKDAGLQVIACTEKASMCIYEIDYCLPSAILLGSEEDGLAQELLSLADRTVKIPMYGQIESLNVSVSAGIVLFEAVRQRFSFTSVK